MHVNRQKYLFCLYNLVLVSNLSLVFFFSMLILSHLFFNQFNLSILLTLSKQHMKNIDIDFFMRYVTTNVLICTSFNFILNILILVSIQFLSVGDKNNIFVYTLLLLLQLKLFNFLSPNFYLQLSFFYPNTYILTHHLSVNFLHIRQN